MPAASSSTAPSASTIRVDGRLEQVQAAQRPDGTIVVVATSEAGVDHVRFVLGLDDDHSEFLAALRRRPAARRDAAPDARPPPDAHRHRRAGAPARGRRPADPGEACAPDRAQHHPRGLARARRHARRADLRRARRVLAGAAGTARARRAAGSGADPPLPQPRARVAEEPARGGRRGAARTGSAASGRGRSASSAWKGSAATSSASRAISGSSSSPPRSGDAGSRPRRRTSCSRRTATWAGLASVYLLAGYHRGLIPLPDARLIA